MLDWRNPEDYTYADDLRLHDWAWEFLRRNKSYRAASEKYWEACERGVMPDISDFTDASMPFNLEEPVDARLPARQADVPWSRYVGMHMLDDYRYRREKSGIPSSELALNFDLTMPLEPQIRQATEYLQIFQKTWLDYVKATEPEVEIGSKRRPQVEKFKGYVRALDGEAVGAPQEEIGRVLFPEASNPRDAARYALKAGREMAERGYLDLLLMENR